MKMKIGDKVIHKKSNQTMVVKSLNEYVATCILDTPVPYKSIGKNKFNNIAVCRIENLKLL